MPTDLHRSRDSRQPRLALLCCVLGAPILASYAIAMRYAINFPYIDDYPNVFKFVLRMNHITSFGAKALYFLNAQHGEYKFLFMHAIVLIELLFTGKVNFNILSFVGDLLLLPLAWVLWKVYFTEETDLIRRLLLFLPIIFLLFQMNYAEGLDWTAASLDYFPVILFSFLSLFLLVRSGRNLFSWTFAGSCLAACLACFSAPNAVVLAPLALFLFTNRRAYSQGIAWGASFLIGIFPYLYHYAHMPVERPGSVKAFVLFYVSFLGAGNPMLKLTVPAGAAILLIYFLSLSSGYYRHNKAAVLIAAWILLSGLFVAWGRGHASLQFSQLSRYRIFSDLLIIFCYGWAAERAPHQLSCVTQRNLFGGALLLTVALCLRADIKYPKELAYRRMQLLEGFSRYRSSPSTESPMYFPDAATQQVFARQEVEARSLLEEVLREKLFDAPDLP